MDGRQETWWKDISRIVEEEMAKKEAHGQNKQSTSVEVDAANLLKVGGGF